MFRVVFIPSDMSARIASVFLASAPRVSHATRPSKRAVPCAAASRGGARPAKVRNQFTFTMGQCADTGSVRGHNCLLNVRRRMGPGVGGAPNRPCARERKRYIPIRPSIALLWPATSFSSCSRAIHSPARLLRHRPSRPFQRSRLCSGPRRRDASSSPRSHGSTGVLSAVDTHRLHLS